MKCFFALLLCFYAGFLYASPPLDSLEAKKARIEANWRIAPAETYALARSLFFESKEVPEIQAWAGNIAGILSAALGMLDSSDWYYQNALVVAKEHGVRETLQKIKMNQGINSNYRGDFKAAALSFYEAIREARVDTNLMLEAYASSNLGFALQRIDLPLQALNYHIKAARLFWSLDQWIPYANELNNLSVLLYEKERDSLSLHAVKQSLRIKLAMGVPNIGANYLNIGNVYMRWNQLDSAEVNFSKALESSRAINDLEMLGQSVYSLGWLHVQKEDFVRAKPLLEEALALAELNDQGYSQQKAADLLATTYGNLGLYKQAYLSRLRADALNDSLYAEDDRVEIEALRHSLEEEQLAFENALKDVQIAEDALKKEQQQLQVIVLASALLLSLLVFLAFFLRSRERQKWTQRQAKWEEEKSLLHLRQKHQEEKQRISQDLHDNVGSRLTVLIHQLDASGDSPELHLAARETLQDLRQAVWLIREEALDPSRLVQRLKNQFGRIQHPVMDWQVEMRHDAPLPPHLAIQMLRVVQELVNNAIKHAKARKIKVVLEFTSCQMSATVSDNGIGMEPEQMQSGGGLDGLNARILNAGGRFSWESRVGKGSSFEVFFPLE